jgi:acetoin utilization deacetylase AcuC-like enzyme
MRLASEVLGAPLGCVLEGGYALGPLARSVAATLKALVAAPTAFRDVAEGPLAREARARLAPWWPGLNGARPGIS